MKEIMVNEPRFAIEFQCVGNQCIDHCCHGWDIVFDKKTLNKYQKSPSIEIRNIASESVEVVKKSHAAWAKVKFNEQNVCGFMDENKLCKVHAQMGAAALSPTCSIYPRSEYKFKNEINKTLTLSCPEAARLLLTTEGAMDIAFGVELRNQYISGRAVNQWDKLINLMSIHLVNAAQAASEQGLYAIASLLLFAQKNPQNVERLEAYFAGLISDIERGVIAEDMAALPTDSQLKWSLLLRLQRYLGTRKSTRALGRLRGYMGRLLQIQTSDIETNKVSDSIVRLEKAWHDIVMPWLNERPYVMRNYLAYRLYSEQFPDSKTRSPHSWLYLLTAEWYLIKSLISATAESKGEIDEQTFIEIIYSFHAVTKHGKAASEAFFAEIENVKVNDDLSLIYLLNQG